MRERLRIVFVEHPHLGRGVAAELLTACRLDFLHQRVASTLELATVAADFNPHIVFCTDEISTNSNGRLLEALQLLCSQTPAILVSSVCELEVAAAGEAGPPSEMWTGPVGEAALRRSAQDAACLRLGFSAVLESSTAPAVITNADGWITHANAGACRQLGGMSERSLVSILRERDDECSPMPHWLSPATSVAAREGNPHRLAYFDSWSLLPTLIHVDDLISGATAGREDAAALALIAVDRDSGRIPGPDDATGGVQNEAHRYGSIVRIAPDDFLVVLPHPCRPEEAAVTTQQVLESIEQSRMHSSHALVRDPQRVRRPRLDSELDEAMLGHALSVHYQPQFDLTNGRGSGVEALARWVLPSGETIAPSIFIPAAERAGKIHELGAWMLKCACETAYAWCGRESQRTTLSVNVSPLQMGEVFCADIGRVLERSRFPAHRLELEITESALMADPDLTIRHLRQWRELGVRIAIDDFGTDYAAVCYLPKLPVNRVKLDQSLVHRMTHDGKSAAVARLIVSMGAELGIDVIAEGVETEQQLKMLVDLGCPRAQGYLLGRPMPAKQAQIALRKAWGNRAMRPLSLAGAAAAADSFAWARHLGNTKVNDAPLPT